MSFIPYDNGGYLKILYTILGQDHNFTIPVNPVGTIGLPAWQVSSFSLGNIGADVFANRFWDAVKHNFLCAAPSWELFAKDGGGNLIPVDGGSMTNAATNAYNLAMLSTWTFKDTNNYKIIFPMSETAIGSVKVRSISALNVNDAAFVNSIINTTDASKLGPYIVSKKNNPPLRFISLVSFPAERFRKTRGYI